MKTFHNKYKNIGSNKSAFVVPRNSSNKRTIVPITHVLSMECDPAQKFYKNELMLISHFWVDGIEPPPYYKQLVSLSLLDT